MCAMVSTAKKLIILGIWVLIFASCWYLIRPQTTTDIPHLMYSEDEVSSDSFFNVTQGSTWQKSLTIYLSSEKEVSIPIENLTRLYYNKTSNFLENQENILTYTFCPNPLIVSHGHNTTVLTVTMAEDAPIGRYDLIWGLGNSNITNIGGYGLIVRVNPK